MSVGKIDINSNNKILYMPVGLPYSGKSTWAKSTDYPLVCPDAIRVALHGQRFRGEAETFVWAIAKYMVKSLFFAGHDKVVLDATSINEKNRNEWVSSFWKRYFVDFKLVTLEKCVRRAVEHEDHYIIPIIKKMNERYEPISLAEVRSGERIFVIDDHGNLTIDV